MQRIMFLIAMVAAVSMATAGQAEAQCGSADSPWPCTGSRCFTQGNTNVTCPKFRRYPGLPYRTTLAVRDRFHPHPAYAYSRSGINASRVDQWAQFQSSSNPWHGNYNYWQYNSPTALVVPPTAAYQTQYNWGVGMTQSVPLAQQFSNRGAVGFVSGGGGEGFSASPYWPSSTEQAGVYPVRAPWSHQ